MISRKTTRLLAETYDSVFSEVTIEIQDVWINPGKLFLGTRPHQIKRYRFLRDKLYEFLYDDNYEPWFIHIFKEMSNLVNDRLFKERIMYMQTGEEFTFFPGPYKEATEEKRQQAGQQYLQKLAQSLLRLHDDKPSEFNKEAEASLQLMQSHLELDGYIYRNRILLPVESSVIDVQAEQSYLESLVDVSKLSDPAIIKHHINLAEEHYVNNRHSDSIGNSRHFLEAILSQTLEGVSTKLGRNLHPNVYKNATTTRDHLEREGLLTQDEKDTLKQIYGLLSNTGGHAFIAEKDQARLMWHLALTCSQFVLLRYEGFLRTQP